MSENQVAKFSFDEFETKDKSNAGYEVTINNAFGEPSGLFITVLGVDSDAYVNLKEKHDRNRIKKMAKKGRGAVEELYDDAKGNDLELLVACTLSWRHASGDKMPFDIGPSSPAETKEFYAKYPLVAEQVRVGMTDRANFTPASANS
jgi:hypothetical protein